MISKKQIQNILFTAIALLCLLCYQQAKIWFNNNQNSTHQLSQNDYPEWTYSKYPEYYMVNGNAQIQYELFPSPGKINYSGKDELGRTQPVYGAITYDMIIKSASEKRPSFKSNEKPSGWTKNSEVSIETTTGTYDGWFLNQSHLIADRLGGATNTDNAITGTRMQNVGSRKQTGGMYYVEELTVDYLRTHRSQYVYYSAKPIYIGNELMARYVVVDVQSSDKVLDSQFIIFNNQNGYTIDYTTGHYTKNKE